MLVRINTTFSSIFGCSVSSDLAHWMFATIYSWANFARQSVNWKKPSSLPRAISFVARTADLTDNIISRWFQPRWWKWEDLNGIIILIQLKWDFLLSCQGLVICQWPLQLLAWSTSMSDSIRIITGQLKHYILYLFMWQSSFGHIGARILCKNIERQKRFLDYFITLKALLGF